MLEIGIILLSAALSALPPVASAQEPPADGILVQRVLVAAYFRDQPHRSARLALLEREVRMFEALLWQHSGRRLRVEATLVPVGRAISQAEVTPYSPEWGYALERSAWVEQDLQQAGHATTGYDGLILLFDPIPSRPCHAAGLTWHRQRYSSIPLKKNLFEDLGHRYPLHLVMVHEYLHQLDSAFEAAGEASGFADPDRMGRTAHASCVLPGDQHPFFRTTLQHDEMCRPTRWRMLDGLMGAWITR